MNLYPKSAHFYDFMSKLYQFMLIFRRFYLTFFVQIHYIDTPAPIFDPKTRIRPRSQKKNLKNPNFPPFWKFFIMTCVNIGYWFYYIAAFSAPAFPIAVVATGTPGRLKV